MCSTEIAISLSRRHGREPVLGTSRRFSPHGLASSCFDTRSNAAIDVVSLVKGELVSQLTNSPVLSVGVTHSSGSTLIIIASSLLPTQKVTGLVELST